MSGGFFAYVQTLGDYESTYGSLAGVAISMFWVWVTVFLVIVGAAINAEAERQTVRDSTVGPERPIGERGRRRRRQRAALSRRGVSRADRPRPTGAYRT